MSCKRTRDDDDYNDDDDVDDNNIDIDRANLQLLTIHPAKTTDWVQTMTVQLQSNSWDVKLYTVIKGKHRASQDNTTQKQEICCKKLTKASSKGIIWGYWLFQRFIMELLSSKVAGGHMNLIQNFLHSQVQSDITLLPTSGLWRPVAAAQYCVSWQIPGQQL